MPAQRAHLVLSAFGADRPGLVAQVTRYVAERGGNVEDTRSVALGGAFGLILLVSGSEEDVQRLLAEAETLERESGLRAVVQPATDPRAKGAHGAAGILLAVTASAFDREGLLLELSEAMRSAGGNIVELETTTYDDSPGGRTCFAMEMTVTVPDADDVERVRTRLQALAARERIALEVRVVDRAAALPHGVAPVR